MRIAAVFLGALILAGCVSTPEPVSGEPKNKPMEPKITREPSLDSVQSTGVGQPIYTYRIDRAPKVEMIMGRIHIEKDIFHQEILYSGVSGDSLRLTYREYVNDMARPAFTQDAVYTLASDTATLVSFKGARVEVMSANNNEIHYRIISGFDGEGA